MVQIKSEGKFNNNTYLVDGQLFRYQGFMSLYIIENNDMRMMVDTSSEIAARKIVKKLDEFGLLPIHKLFITHSHWDHRMGVSKLKKLMGDFEVLASENAIDDLANPERLIEIYRYNLKPVENVTPLKDGDIINLNGLELEVMNFFGHTMDSIAIYDKKNKNIFVGDALIYKFDYETFVPNFMPPSYNLKELLETYEKLKNMKNDLNSISIGHYGVWKDEVMVNLINELEKIHLETKDAIIEWYSENPSLEYIVSKYHEKFTPDSKLQTKDNMVVLKFLLETNIKGLQYSGFIK